jgi:hypothetical protein
MITKEEHHFAFSTPSPFDFLARCSLSAKVHMPPSKPRVWQEPGRSTIHVDGEPLEVAELQLIVNKLFIEVKKDLAFLTFNDKSSWSNIIDRAKSVMSEPDMIKTQREFMLQILLKSRCKDKFFSIYFK